VAADHRSIYPNLPGLPWWAVVVVAATATAVGFAFDAGSGNKELTDIFAALYVLGCVVAALAVRQSGVFTAVIQPPLILFCAVPGAYWLFHGATFTDVKGILINCGYPLIDRFPLMLFTAAGVLLIGMGRWYFGMATRAATPKADAGATARPRRRASIAKKLGTKLTAMFNRDPARAARATAPRRRRVVDRPGRATTPPHGSGPTHYRHARPLADDTPDPRAQRPRRGPAPAHDDRPRLPQDYTRRGQPTREARRQPHLRTGQPTTRGSRMDQPAVPPEPPPRHRPAPRAGNGVNATHHPISRVRYRSPDP
jgi:hypothetical protein